MKRMTAAASPDAFVEALDGWRRTCVAALRAAIRKSAPLEETIKWGNLVYFARGPVLMVRAEEQRVLLGFWRGQRLRDLEPRLKPGGKYEMATMELREGTRISAAQVLRLTKQAVVLNQTKGNPTDAAPSRATRGRAPEEASRAKSQSAKPRGTKHHTTKAKGTKPQSTRATPAGRRGTE